MKESENSPNPKTRSTILLRLAGLVFIISGAEKLYSQDADMSIWKLLLGLGLLMMGVIFTFFPNTVRSKSRNS